MRANLAVIIGFLSLAWACNAKAYCRTSTCDTGDGFNDKMMPCARDTDGCTIEGTPVSWPCGCVTYGVQYEGSQLRGLDAELVDELMQKAFSTWTKLSCEEGGTPPIVAQSFGPVLECDQPEFNCSPQDHNTNTVIFRDDGWPASYGSAALAITTVTVNMTNGDILDADMEINSNGFTFTTSDTEVNNDLLSVLTHEVGHFLGLAHSAELGSTMFANYDSADSSIRKPKGDDIAGICEIYPPADVDPTCAPAERPDTDCLGSTECGKGVRAEVNRNTSCGAKQPEDESSSDCGIAPAVGATSSRTLRADDSAPTPPLAAWALGVFALFGVVTRRLRRSANT